MFNYKKFNIQNYNKLFLFVIIYLILSLFTAYGYISKEFALTNGITNAIRSDAIGYYAYIHLIFNPDDICFTNYYNTSIAYMPEVQWGLKPIPLTQCYTPIYTIGLALFWLPFVILVGMPLNVLLNGSIYPVDIFSIPFQISVTMSSALYVSMGIYFLYAALEIFFKKQVIILTLFSFLLGSNLIHYATLDGIFTHAASFLINSASVYLLTKFLYKESDFNSINLFMLGFLPTLGVVIRTTNITFLLFTLIVLFKSRKCIRSFLIIIIGFILGAIPSVIQFTYWWYATGKITYFPYWEYEGFSFLRANLFSLFFSFNPHGVVPYSPILIFAFMGFILGFTKHLNLFAIFLCILLANTLIISSWSSPYGGGGLGNRFFVDFYPFFIFGLAFFYNKFKNILVAFGIILFTGFLSLRVTYLYWLNVIDYGGENLSDLISKILLV